jgi:hypothetical protein
MHRQQENDRYSINIEPIMETPPLAESCEQAPDHRVEQSRCASNPSLPSLTEPCYSLQAASVQVPIIVNPELARCSKRSPSLTGASSVAYPARGKEVSKKPPALRQANASNALRRRAGLNAGASCVRCLRAAEVLLLPLLRCKPYLTSVPTDCGSSSPYKASLVLPTCRPRRSRLSPSSSL